MSTILPPSLPTTTAQSAGTVLSPLTLANTASAEALSELSPGTMVEGQVQAKTGTNQMTITTDNAGTLTVQAKGAAADVLTPGAKVALQVVPGPDGQLALRIVSVDSQALARPITLSTPPILPDLPVADVLPETNAAAAVVPPTVSAPPPGLVATVIRPAVTGDLPVVLPATVTASAAPAASTSPASSTASVDSGAAAASAPVLDGGLPANLPVGTTVGVRILDVSQGGGGVPSSPAGSNGTPVAAAQVPATATNGPASAVPAPAGPVKDTLPPLMQSLSADPVPPDSTEPSLPILEGKVVNTVPGQRANVETPIGTLSLPPVAALKPNVDVRFEVVSPPVLPQSDSADDDSPQNHDPIKVLNDGLATLMAEGDSPTLQQVMAAIPQLDERLAASLSAFAKNIDRQTAVEEDEGEEDEGGSEQVGASEGKDTAARMNGALRQMASEVTEHQGQEGSWQGFKIPLDVGGLITPVQFFVRQPPSDDGRVTLDGDENGSGGTARNRDKRFVVELMLSRLGRFQMDGLVQRTDKRFDLIIRTQQHLPRQMRNDITDLFLTTTEASGSRGSVTFQAGGRFVSVVKAGDQTKISI